MELDASAFIVATICALILAAAFTLMFGARSERDILARMQGTIAGQEAAVGNAPQARPSALLGLLTSIGERLRHRALMSDKDILNLERSLTAAGLNPRRAVSIFLGLKAALVVTLPAVGFAGATFYETGNELVVAGGCGVVGLMGPNWVLGFLRGRYVKALNKGLPDAMDMLVVCAEAGLGLDSAVERVAREMAGSNQAVASEFALLAHELRVMPDRRVALARLQERALVDLLKRLAATLGQTFRFGTPLAQALRILAAEARQDRVVRLENKAARLPALMVLPLILFIMPCLFIVLVGPSVVTLSETFGG
uniref:type II secretion system F family protein n=1 Tax=uncultured Sphingomonas sp. TaxID=158754 RepID=UPI0025D8E754|nr:type II secretion system F family protein [uncultured Sphingomonas sp.]